MTDDRLAPNLGSAVTAVVLAGGRSSRFGRSKLQQPFGPTTLLGATIGQVRQVAGEVVVVGLTTGLPRILAGSLPDEGSRVRVVADDAPFEGPLVGLRRGLEDARTESVLVIAGDMPLVPPLVLRLLVERLAAEPAASAAGLLDGSEARPLPLALRRDAALAAVVELLARGERSLRALLAALAAARVPEAEWRALDPHGDALLDVDRPADLSRALERASDRASDRREIGRAHV